MPAPTVARAVVAALLASVLGACAQAGPTAQWTVMVYMAADNGLERAALLNLKQMASVGSTDDVNVVVQVDRRANSLAGDLLNLPAWGTTKRLYVQNGSFQELSDLRQTDMTDPRVLHDFIGWAKSQYPAQRYALVLWDHGDTWHGFGDDDSSGRDAWMSLPEIASALDGVGGQLDFLGFDACLMANTEVALELQSRARVLVASEEEEPGVGWDYAAMLGALTGQPALDGIGLAKAVADAYLPNIERNAPRQALYSDLSVVDLTQMGRVSSALKAFVANLERYTLAGAPNNPSEQLGRIGQLLGRARYETPAFGRSAFNDPGETFDLGLLAANAGKFLDDQEVARSGADLNAALALAVPYAVSGLGYGNAKLSGLSLYLPIEKAIAESSAHAYGSLSRIKETNWPAYIRAFTNAAQADKVRPRVTQPQLSTAVVVPGVEGATMTGQVSDETMVTGVVAGVTAALEQGVVIVSFEELPRTYRTTNDYSFAFDGQGWYLDDDQNHQLVFTVQWYPSQRAVFGLYQQDAKSKAREAYLVYDEVSGALIGGFEKANGMLGALLPGVDSLFQPYLYTPELNSLPTNPVQPELTTLEKAALPEGPYLLSVTGFDLGGNTASASAIVVVLAATA